MREKEVVMLLLEGLSNEEMAGRMAISTKSRRGDGEARKAGMPFVNWRCLHTSHATCFNRPTYDSVVSDEPHKLLRLANSYERITAAEVGHLWG